MSDLLNDIHQLKLRLGALEFLLLALLPRLKLLDPGFGRYAHGWLDQEFGKHYSEGAVGTDPQVLSAIRKHYLLLLEGGEVEARIAPSVPKPKPIRRRIFEWFERA